MLDLHNHSFFSPDSSTRTEDMVEAAIEKGVKYFGISEHIEFVFSGDAAKVFIDYKTYLKYALALKKKYKDQINFLIGFEIGYMDCVDVSLYRKLVKQCGLDYVINSIHMIDNEDCFYAESFEGYTKEQRYTQYLKEVLKSVKADFDYQIVGHLGYISRNAPYSDPIMHYADYAELIDQILKVIIERDKTIELNSSGRTCGTPYLPHDDILKRYFELGGRNVTFGSDSHNPKRILDKYAIAIEGLKKIGFQSLCVFSKKERSYVSV